MKSFKAPYKAVLIELFQTAKKKNNDLLQNQIKTYFDNKYSIDEWSVIFQEYGLDDSLVKPSFVTNMNPIIQAIKDQIQLHPDVNLFSDNLKTVLEWEKTYKNVHWELKESNHGQLSRS
jgi:hypothetical protein